MKKHHHNYKHNFPLFPFKIRGFLSFHAKNAQNTVLGNDRSNIEGIRRFLDIFYRREKVTPFDLYRFLLPVLFLASRTVILLPVPFRPSRTVPSVLYRSPPSQIVSYFPYHTLLPVPYLTSYTVPLFPVTFITFRTNPVLPVLYRFLLPVLFPFFLSCTVSYFPYCSHPSCPVLFPTSRTVPILPVLYRFLLPVLLTSFLCLSVLALMFPASLMSSY